MYIQQLDTHYLLRPEFIESLWAMYQITGNTTYQMWGWQIFEVRFKENMFVLEMLYYRSFVCAVRRTLREGSGRLYIDRKCSRSE